MAYCHEYKCGCIVHTLAGTIRKCSGVPSRTLSGKPSKGEGGDNAHASALGVAPVRSYEVAEILP